MRPDETLGAWVALAMRRLSNAFTTVLQKECQRLGKPIISPPQWSVLARIQEAGAMPVGTLAQQQGVDASVATGLVSRLEKMELLTRVHDTADRRVVRLTLTEEGEQLVQLLVPVVQAFQAQCVRGLSEEQQEQLLRQLQHVIANVADIEKG